MAVLVALAVVVTSVGSLLWLAVLRWPAVDPADPRIEHDVVVGEVVRHPGLRALLARRLDPTATTGLALTAGGLVVVGGAATVGVLLAMVRSSTGLADFDLGTARWAARHATERSTDVLHVVTWVGSTVGIVVLAIGVLLFAGFAARRLPPGRAAAFLLVVLGGQNLVNNLVKYVVDRARPSIDQLAHVASPSFPSGHSAAAAAGLAAFALLLGRRRPARVKALLAGAAGGIAAGVAATRVLLGVHWLTDVLAGLALGWAWFALASLAFGGRLLRFGAPVVDATATAERLAEATGQEATPGR